MPAHSHRAHVSGTRSMNHRVEGVQKQPRSEREPTTAAFQTSFPSFSAPFGGNVSSIHVTDDSLNATMDVSQYKADDLKLSFETIDNKTEKEGWISQGKCTCWENNVIPLVKERSKWRNPHQPQDFERREQILHKCLHKRVFIHETSIPQVSRIPSSKSYQLTIFSNADSYIP